MNQSVKHIAITGAAGQIAYQLIFRIASGELFGTDQPVQLSLLEVPIALSMLEGVKMELNDCAFSLLRGIEVTADAYQAFKECDLAILIGSKPRGPGMERQDLLKDNGKIFVEQGQALNEVAKNDAKIFVVGNPCNTNCLIAMSHAPRLSPKNFFAMTRLDQNRATFFLAQKAGVPITDVSQVIIWGNHSSTQVPDFTHARIQQKSATEMISDRAWLENDFIDFVRKRGAAIIQARGKSSAASAAQAVMDSIKDVFFLNKKSELFSAGIISDGNPYGIKNQLIFSFPCLSSGAGEVSIFAGFDLSEFLEKEIKKTERELIEERDLVKSLIYEGH